MSEKRSWKNKNWADNKYTNNLAPHSLKLILGESNKTGKKGRQQPTQIGRAHV